MSEGLVYILALRDNNYYIGWSQNIEERIVAHFTGQGSAWTIKHPPEKVLDVRAGGKILEKLITLEYMIKHEWEHVRGGPWTAVDLKSPPVVLRKSKESLVHTNNLIPGTNPGVPADSKFYDDGKEETMGQSMRVTKP